MHSINVKSNYGNLSLLERIPPNEQYYRFKPICGIQTVVRAQCIKGRVKGEVSLARSTENFDFDFEP